LEPLLKEVFWNAPACPVSAEQLQAFVQKISEESGIKIEYGTKDLESDYWPLTVMANKK
jgi:hypothetical protein